MSGEAKMQWLNGPHQCPGCDIVASGSCVKRLNRTWHTDCWVKHLEAAGARPICACGSPAVLWLSVARDKGQPLCGECADATKAYIERKCREVGL